jgi:hypothetical protein
MESHDPTKLTRRGHDGQVPGAETGDAWAHPGGAGGCGTEILHAAVGRDSVSEKWTACCRQRYGCASESGTRPSGQRQIECEIGIEAGEVCRRAVPREEHMYL